MNYWLGFNTTQWPSFLQQDRTFTTKYRNWGTFVSDAGSRVEPNNVDDPEWCLSTNYSESVKNAWGYQDTRCTNSFIFMCRAISAQIQAAGHCCC
jgi:hypothetical protein